VRRALLSVAVGLAGAAGVTASGWALQAGALPRPRPADRVVADASVWFHEHRLVVDIFHFDHRRERAACLRGWFVGAQGYKAPASLLSLRSGLVLRISARRRISVVAGRPSGIWPIRLLAAAGCSGELASATAAAAQGGWHLRVERAYAANRPAIALRLWRVERRRLTLYVSPRTYRPLVAIAAIDGEQVTARLYLGSVTHQVLASFHLLRESESRPHG